MLQRINDVAIKLLVPETAEETYEVVVKEAMKAVKAKYGSIFVKKSRYLERVYSSNKGLNIVKARKKGFTYTAFKEHRMLILNNKDLTHIHPELRQLGIKCVIVIPLSYNKKSIGVLTLQLTNNIDLDKDMITFFRIFGSMASLKIRNSQLLEQTKAALETRELFISLASHELKTPMTSVYGYAQLLKRPFKNEQKRDEIVQKLIQECKRLNNLTNELLEINRIKSGKLQYNIHENNISDIIAKAVEYFKFAYPKNTIIVNNSLLPQRQIVCADDDKLTQVITNILNNAQKFSKDDSPIEINLSSDPKFVIVDIKDQGVGIHQDDIPRVFEGFYKGKNGSSQGMGLGLFLAKEIITKHKGKISIDSADNIGTTVKIKLPTPKN